VTSFATSCNTHHLICCRPGTWKKRWRLKIFGGSSWDNLGEIGVSTKSMKQMDGEYEKSPKPLGIF